MIIQKHPPCFINNNLPIPDCTTLKTQLKLKTNGFVLTPENKPKLLECYKNQGKRFLDEHTSK